VEVRLGKIVDIRSAELAWNRKHAKRRFRRFFDEIQRKPLEIPEPELGRLAVKIIEEGDEPGLEDSDVDEILVREVKPPSSSEAWVPTTKRWAQLRAYEYRKRAEPLPFFGKLPKEMQRLLEEAQEAHRWGLFRSVIILCRSVLEIAVDNLDRALRKASRSASNYLSQGGARIPASGQQTPSPNVVAFLKRLADLDARLVEDSRLDQRLNSLKGALQELNWKIEHNGSDIFGIANSIRKTGNDVVHEGIDIAENVAFKKLDEAVLVVSYFLEWARFWRFWGGAKEAPARAS
jgi:hypothetical protein